jgi:hypothetical protein
VNNSRRLGLALFAVAVIVFFGQQYVLALAYMIASLLPPGSGFYSIMSLHFPAIYTLTVILIILGVVMFYKGHKEANITTSASAEK